MKTHNVRNIRQLQRVIETNSFFIMSGPRVSEYCRNLTFLIWIRHFLSPFRYSYRHTPGSDSPARTNFRRTIWPDLPSETTSGSNAPACHSGAEQNIVSPASWRPAT
jgi:hypothetical protein